jgi:hypothetical protein
MHNYGANMANGVLSENPAKAAAWELIIPEESAKYPFLMHGVLALSASHLRYHRPAEAEKWAVLTSHHQNLALPAFRTEISRLSEQNCKALFAMASICISISMSLISQGPISGPEDETSSLDAIVQMFILTRGLYTSLEPLWHVLMAPPLHVLINGARMDDYSQHTLPRELQSQIDKLYSLCDRSCNDPNTRLVYLDPIRRLEEVYKDILFMHTADRDELGLVLKWAVASESSFNTLISDRDPLALIIVAHYIILVSSLKRWFVDGLSNRGWAAIVENLPNTPEVAELLQWPKRQLDEGLPAFSAGNFPRD